MSARRWMLVGMLAASCRPAPQASPLAVHGTNAPRRDPHLAEVLEHNCLVCHDGDIASPSLATFFDDHHLALRAAAMVAAERMPPPPGMLSAADRQAFVAATCNFAARDTSTCLRSYGVATDRPLALTPDAYRRAVDASAPRTPAAPPTEIETMLSHYLPAATRMSYLDPTVLLLRLALGRERCGHLVDRAKLDQCLTKVLFTEDEYRVGQ